MSTGSGTSRDKIRQYLANVQREVDSAALYQALSIEERKPEIAEVYRRLAATESAHKEFWKKRLTELGSQVPEFRVGWRTRTLIWLAQRRGPDFVLPVVSTIENADVSHYEAQSEAVADGFNEAERSHARIIRAVSASAPIMSVGPLANALRAAVLGANDGLASNLSLVMGVAGAHLASRTILVTGLSGLVAGAFAMAMGEWLSVSTSRESHGALVNAEAMQSADISNEEREQLASIYLAQGLSEDEARSAANHRAIASAEEFSAYEWHAAVSSFLLFAGGALFPVLPYFFLSGAAAMPTSIVVSSAALFLIGAGATLFTGRSIFFSGVRQLLVGLAAAAVTYALGHLIGAVL